MFLKSGVLKSFFKIINILFLLFFSLLLFADEDDVLYSPLFAESLMSAINELNNGKLDEDVDNYCVPVNDVTASESFDNIANIDTVSPGSELRIDGHDVYAFIQAFGTTPEDDSWEKELDLNNDLIIDEADFELLINSFGSGISHFGFTYTEVVCGERERKKEGERPTFQGITCSGHTCTGYTCSMHTCESGITCNTGHTCGGGHTCTTHTCGGHTCTGYTCSGYTCIGYTCLGYTCSGYTCDTFTCRGNTCDTYTCRGHTCDTYTCIGHTCIGQTCTGYTCTGHTCTGHTCTGYTCTGYTCTGHTCTGYTCTGHTCSGYTCSGHTCTGICK